MGHLAPLTTHSNGDSTFSSSQRITASLKRSASSKTLQHGNATTQQNPAQGVCLGDRDMPPGVVGGEVHRAKRNRSTRGTNADSAHVHQQQQVSHRSMSRKDNPGLRMLGHPARDNDIHTRDAVTDHCVDYTQCTVVKSFGNEDATTSQDPAQGVCLGNRG